MGDRCRVTDRTGGHQFKIGELVTLTKEYDDDAVLYWRASSGDDYWYLNAEELEHVDD